MLLRRGNSLTVPGKVIRERVQAQFFEEEVPCQYTFQSLPPTHTCRKGFVHYSFGNSGKLSNYPPLDELEWGIPLTRPILPP